VIDRLVKLVISVAFALKDMLAQTLSDKAGQPGSCVVINYHTVSADLKSRFGRQLDLLVRLARPVRADKELRLENGRRYVAITVDDVFESFVANGLPELCRRNIPVTLFPPTAYFGQKSAWDDYGGQNKIGESVVSENNLKAISKLGNVHFGSHGVTHADLALLPEAETRQELQDSKRSLENLVAREIVALSFPYGSHGPRELRLAREAGYRFLFDSTPQQMVSIMGEGLIGRVDVQASDWNIEFKLKVYGAYRWVRKASVWKRKVRSWFAKSSATKELKHA
jgi:peptidoglycan/xylan/chitin deacetylase (PgdA/CDA1 family)